MPPPRLKSMVQRVVEEELESSFFDKICNTIDDLRAYVQSGDDSLHWLNDASAWLLFQYSAEELSEYIFSHVPREIRVLFGSEQVIRVGDLMNLGEVGMPGYPDNSIGCYLAQGYAGFVDGGCNDDNAVSLRDCNEHPDHD